MKFLFGLVVLFSIVRSESESSLKNLMNACKSLGFPEDCYLTLTPKKLRTRYLALARKTHPDKKGGDSELMKIYNSARDLLEVNLKSPSFHARERSSNQNFRSSYNADHRNYGNMGTTPNQTKADSKPRNTSPKDVANDFLVRLLNTQIGDEPKYYENILNNPLFQPTNSILNALIEKQYSKLLIECARKCDPININLILNSLLKKSGAPHLVRNFLYAFSQNITFAIAFDKLEIYHKNIADEEFGIIVEFISTKVRSRSHGKLLFDFLKSIGNPERVNLAFAKLSHNIRVMIFQSYLAAKKLEVSSSYYSTASIIRLLMENQGLRDYIVTGMENQEIADYIISCIDGNSFEDYKYLISFFSKLYKSLDGIWEHVIKSIIKNDLAVYFKTLLKLPNFKLPQTVFDEKVILFPCYIANLADEKWNWILTYWLSTNITKLEYLDALKGIMQSSRSVNKLDMFLNHEIADSLSKQEINGLFLNAAKFGSLEAMKELKAFQEVKMPEPRSSKIDQMKSAVFVYFVYLYAFLLNYFNEIVPSLMNIGKKDQDFFVAAKSIPPSNQATSPKIKQNIIIEDDSASNDSSSNEIPSNDIPSNDSSSDKSFMEDLEDFEPFDFGNMGRQRNPWKSKDKSKSFRNFSKDNHNPMKNPWTTKETTFTTYFNDQNLQFSTDFTQKKSSKRQESSDAFKYGVNFGFLTLIMSLATVFL